MPIPLFDVQTGFGGAKTGQPVPLPPEELLDEMERLSIDRALVRTVPDELERDWPAANAMLFDACESQPAWTPCPVVVPATADDYPPEEQQVAEHIARGAGAAWIRVAKDFWNLCDWVCGPLLRALEARRLPVFCLERDVTVEQVADLAARCPDLPILFAGVDYREQRTLLPLLRSFPNVHLSLGNNYTMHGGIEQFVAKVGADQLLFGTGFPDAEPMGAVTQLTYADVSDADKAKIGSGNVERLLEGIVR